MWYPNKAQWWVIWITGILLSVAVLAAMDTVGFIVVIPLLGGLLILQLSKKNV
jgi:hypothetical protein